MENLPQSNAQNYVPMFTGNLAPFNGANRNPYFGNCLPSSKPSTVAYTKYCQIQQGMLITSSTLDLSTPSLKRSHDNSRASSASPDSNRSTPKKRSIDHSGNNLSDYSSTTWSTQISPDHSAYLATVSILNTTFINFKNDLMCIHLKRTKIQNNLKYLVQNVLPNVRFKLPYLKLTQEHIFEVISTANFFYKSISDELCKTSQALYKIEGSHNNETLDYLTLKGKQISCNMDMLRDLDGNVLASINHVLGKIMLTNRDSKYSSIVTQIQCWVLDLLVRLLPGYIHRIMKVSATNEARGISVKESRSRKRCLADWFLVAKSLNSGKIEVYTTLNRFTAIAGVSAILQYSEEKTPIKDIISNTFDENTVQKTYDICKDLEEIIEPLRAVEKILSACLIKDETLSHITIDQVHNPLYEKRLCSFRTGSSSAFPKQLLGELERLFHHDFIQGPTFLATQQYERRCGACHKSLGQECILCAGCYLVRYCGDYCAKSDEAKHEKICSVDRFEILRIFLEKVAEENNCPEIEVV